MMGSSTKKYIKVEISKLNGVKNIEIKNIL